MTWKNVTADRVRRTLRNPVYAGAYAYGRTKVGTRVVDGQLRPVVTRQPRSKWSVLLQDHHEAYISWEQFERVGDMLSKNVQNQGVPGAARGGSALLGGLVWCRRCGRRLRVSYSGASSSRYVCDEEHSRSGGPRCISFSAIDVDAQIATQVAAIVQPGAIEAARAARLNDTMASATALRALELQLQQARYLAERAERQYDTVEPENRTVASELERRWNKALEAVSAIEQRMDEATAEQGSGKENSLDGDR